MPPSWVASEIRSDHRCFSAATLNAINREIPSEADMRMRMSISCQGDGSSGLSARMMAAAVPTIATTRTTVLIPSEYCPVFRGKLPTTG